MTHERGSHVGRVHLVGAGPGDPGLLTLRGAELLGGADVVVHDRLVSEDVLAMAPPHAELIDVGKVPGGENTSQAAINSMLVDHALRGRKVVRLKGGDPFVFGRGSEELAACRAAGVPCEVIAGVSSAIAGPAAAGIPVTARGVARTFAVATARSGEGLAPAEPDFAALAAMDTVVLLMGRERLGEFAGRLIEAGRNRRTPAAIVERATLPGQRTVVATLGTIADAADVAGIAPPAVLVVGETAAWAQASPDAPPALGGLRVVVTRPPSASAELVAALRQRGADVIECPLIAIEYPDPPPPLPDLGAFDWLVVTSLHGVRGFWRCLEGAALDGRSLGRMRIATVGPKAASELWKVGRLRADVVPDEHRAEALVREFGRRCDGAAKPVRVLIPCGTLAREETATGLRSLGATVTELTVYDTVAAAPTEATRRRIGRGVDTVLLYSPSAAKSLVAQALPVGDAAIVCVGPTTAEAAQRLGLAAPIVPALYGDHGVIEALEAWFAPKADPAVHTSALAASSGGTPA